MKKLLLLCFITLSSSLSAMEPCATHLMSRLNDATLCYVFGTAGLLAEAGDTGVEIGGIIGGAVASVAGVPLASYVGGFIGQGVVEIMRGAGEGLSDNERIAQAAGLIAAGYGITQYVIWSWKGGN